MDAIALIALAWAVALTGLVVGVLGRPRSPRCGGCRRRLPDDGYIAFDRGGSFCRRCAAGRGFVAHADRVTDC